MKIGSSPNSERRKFPRLKDNIFFFGNLSPNSINLMPDLIGGFKAITKNICAGGLMFEMDKNIIKKGDKLELDIYQPINRDKTMIFSIPVLAKVIWTKKREKEHFENGENKYKIGTEFLEIDAEHRQKIARYIEEIASIK
jgi:c-di-GMP-binding flagellar brake protein YcgR